MGAVSDSWKTRRCAQIRKEEKHMAVYQLKELLKNVSYSVLNGSDEAEVAEIVNDSRRAKEGSVFVCIKGAVADGHK